MWSCSAGDGSHSLDREEETGPLAANQVMGTPRHDRHPLSPDIHLLT